jgi:glycerophosphoryl diester phosphodiesterase
MRRLLLLMFCFRSTSLLRPTLVLGLALTGLATSGTAGEGDARALFESPRPLVIAHRGYSSAAPENTLGAFRLAIASGADLVELDYHRSRDGVPVVIHDSTLDRTTDAMTRWGGKDLRVADRTAAELATLDAGRWFDGRTVERLPSLAQALELLTAAKTVTLIERKAGDAATLARLLRERGWVNRVVVQSFDWSFLRELHALLPEQILAALGPPHARRTGAAPLREGQPDDDAWNELAAAGVRIVVWDRNLTAANTAVAHARGFNVWIYTIDEPAVARELRGRGVDGFITNNPSILWKTLGELR